MAPKQTGGKPPDAHHKCTSRHAASSVQLLCGLLDVLRVFAGFISLATSHTSSVLSLTMFPKQKPRFWRFSCRQVFPWFSIHLSLSFQDTQKGRICRRNHMKRLVSLLQCQSYQLCRASRWIFCSRRSVDSECWSVPVFILFSITFILSGIKFRTLFFFSQVIHGGDCSKTSNRREMYK